MENNQMNSPHKRQAKDTKCSTQKEVALKAISNNPKTMLMVFVDTGIKRTNICKVFSILTREGKIRFIGKAPCKVSTKKAGFYVSTSNDS
ncbi:hypothetical protein [Aequorivita capsosiphonis]|uniref:hypothetical protein n=1 Tax=Aequorivita capsosiphonis TaxID=487317 RepID=UPI00047EAE5A|nr:hypothetical protein [Aequorivita capsosiphonis]